ncbi:DUF6600 domain-containing protein [Silvimonas amylolytica]|uniref:FecR family protein n=1 Tax=Silvimonas amylolytica TaxID=449663 RepID=A0ABQ2PGF9_9NEIS|nr:DUF6600 domain-containing protein [Silvimonas amylolytica]GGP24378.1 hypothetical protein GCM10010971_01970 [Silvimonas amylolytica]
MIRSHLLCSLALIASLLVGQALADDAPTEVARLNDAEGNVTFAPAGSNDWAYAPINRPMTTGDQLWVDRGGRAELHAGSTALRLGDQTSMSFLALDDNNTQLKVTQGTLGLRVRSLYSGQRIEVDTPNLAFTINTPGDYRLDINPNDNTTRVTVRQGNGTALGSNGNSFNLHDGDQVSWGGTELQELSATVNPPHDQFDQWAQGRDRHEDTSISARYVPREVTGYESLDDNGTWQTVADYGPVWVPRTTIVGWAPYRFGHWVWIAPWGWTWVDDAPWGFAPFHYGRWAYLGSSWCWVPGRPVPRPVYAPALVAFAGGINASVHITIGGGPGVAWLPLGPGEAYHPAYVSSPTYITNINRTTVINNVTVNKTVYVNQAAPNAINGMAANNFVRGQPVQAAVANFKPQQFTHAQFNNAPGVAPVAQSVIGNARPAPSVHDINVNRPVISTRTPPQPFASRDDLANRYAAHAAVPGAGPALASRANTPAAQVNIVKGGDARPTNTTPAQPQRGQPQEQRPAPAPINNVPHPPTNLHDQPTVQNHPVAAAQAHERGNPLQQQTEQSRPQERTQQPQQSQQPQPRQQDDAPRPPQATTGQPTAHENRPTPQTKPQQGHAEGHHQPSQQHRPPPKEETQQHKDQ